MNSRWTHFTFIQKVPGRRVDPSPGPVSCVGGHIFIYSKVRGRRVDPSPGPVSCVGGLMLHSFNVHVGPRYFN